MSGISTSVVGAGPERLEEPPLYASHVSAVAPSIAEGFRGLFRLSRHGRDDLAQALPSDPKRSPFSPGRRCGTSIASAAAVARRTKK
ncbi:hypothetical protein KHC27_03420 [Ancylobacter lacus]|nr:hypothetical protein [Ancylobacter lacus]